MATTHRAIKHAVIIVNYNGWQDTLDCIASVKKAKDSPYIIVVDNASTDESVRELLSHYQDLDLIASKVNSGFSAGNNLGIRRALRLGAKVIYLLNNDTTVDHNLFFRSYRYVAGKKRIAGGKIYYAKGYEFHPEDKNRGNILWYAGGEMDWRMALAKHVGVDKVDHGQYDSVRSVEFITGCFMAIPKQAFSRLGYLDEEFFLYLEDTDYCLRALSAGFELKYNPSLILYHRNSSSSGVGSPLVDYYMTRNRFVIGRRYGTWRLQFALFREALLRNWDSPVRRQAFLDYIFHKLGKRHESL